MIRGRYNPINYTNLAGKLDHSLLLNLDVDDHPQYLLIDGSRDMTGALTIVSDTNPQFAIESSLGSPVTFHKDGGILSAISDGGFYFNTGDGVGVFEFGNTSPEGEMSVFSIYGYRTSDSLRSLNIRIGEVAADTAHFYGVSNFRFDTLTLASGSISDSGNIGIKPDGDNDDYVTFSTADNQTTFHFVGQDGRITAEGGDISFDNENLSSSGTLNFGGITGTSLTDSTLSISSGSITGGVNATFSGNVTITNEAGGVQGLVLGVNQDAYIKVYSSDDMYISNRNKGKKMRFEIADGDDNKIQPLIMTATSFDVSVPAEFTSLLDVIRTDSVDDAIFTGARLFYRTTGTPTAGIGTAFSMRAESLGGNDKNTGYFGGRLDNVGDGTELGALTMSPDFQVSEAYATTREFSVACVAVDEILVSMTKGNLAVTDGNLSVNGDATFSASVDSSAVADEVSVGGYDISAGNRALAISSEATVAAEVDETKFSHKLPVRINGSTYYIMLTAT